LPLVSAPPASCADPFDSDRPPARLAIRVILVGTVEERATLRTQLSDALTPSGGVGALEVAGECSTMAAARASTLEADAIVIARGTTVAGDRLEEPLTPREIEVVELLAEGLPNKRIAARLHISDQTVKFHVASICGKLAAANRTDAVRRAIRRGVIAV
jgi:DNA-binding CsgD family transcriptional regulator